MNVPIGNTFAPVQPWLAEVTSEFLTKEQMAQLDVLFGCIWPADHARGLPGAVDVKASRFVSRLLSRDSQTYEEIPQWRELYPAMLAALDQYAVSKFSFGLIGMAGDQVLTVLKAMETGALADFPVSHLGVALDQKNMFGTLRRHCIQGCLVDERWGGNDQRMMWRAIGYPNAPEDLFEFE